MRLAILGAFATVALLGGCGGEAPPPPADTSTETAAPQPGPTPSPPGARVFIITPVNGATVSSPVEVKFGISGMAVTAAGDYSPATGHHHLLIDTQLEDFSLPIPTSENLLHFGKGQTETTLELAPGQHSLQLVLGDGSHIPHEPPVTSARITITVE